MSKSPKGKEGRLGDETRARINELKGGWGVPDDAGTTPPESDEPPKAEPSPRSGAPSRPPPLPSSATSSAKPPAPTSGHSAAGVTSGSAPSVRGKGPTKPPPRKKPTQPPPLPKRRAKASQPPPIRKDTSAARALPKPAVISSEGAGDDSPTARNDLDSPDAISAGAGLAASGSASGTVRLPDSIPRRSGVVGDVAYLFRVLAKRRSSSVELAKLAQQIATLKEARAIQLLQVARHAIGDDRNDQTLVGLAREDLLKIEEKRSLHAGRVAAAEEKMAALSRHRSDKAARRTEEEDTLRKEVASINASLKPLQTRADNARKRTGDLRKHLKAIDDKIQKQEASLVSVAGPADKAAVHANIASLRAERDTVAADEPIMAAEIDDLDPKISSLISSRSALDDKVSALGQERELDEERVQEKEVAVQASKAVESRAVDDQANKRQEALLELGEALHNKPAEVHSPRESAIEKQDLEIGTLERRRLELKELRNSVEAFPMIMGAMWLLLLAGSITAAAIFVTAR